MSTKKEKEKEKLVPVEALSEQPKQQKTITFQSVEEMIAYTDVLEKEIQQRATVYRECVAKLTGVDASAQVTPMTAFKIARAALAHSK